MLPIFGRTMTENLDTFRINEDEIMRYYGYTGIGGRWKLRIKLFRSWLLHSLAYSSPHPSFAIAMQRARGVEIGKNCHISPYVQIDLLYPNMVKIGDNVTIGSNTMIFAHSNMPTNLSLKKGDYARKVAPVIIESGAWINPGCIITAGLTIGKNSILAVGSVATEDVPDSCVVVGNPARVIKKLTNLGD